MKNIALALIIVGALNWGLVGFLNFDLVATLLGDMSVFSRVVYGLVGLSGLGFIVTRFAKPEAVRAQ